MMRIWLILAAALLAQPALAGPQDTWTIDPRASSLTFSVAQVGSFVSGRFSIWTGEIVLDPSTTTTARIDIRIDTRSVTANNSDVETLLKGPSFLSVLQFPEARFVSTSVSPKGGDRYEAQGRLTIREVTRDLALPFTLAIVEAPGQPGVLHGTARGRVVVNRLDHGVGKNEWAGTGHVANEVTIDLNVVAIRPR